MEEQINKTARSNNTIIPSRMNGPRGASCPPPCPKSIFIKTQEEADREFGGKSEWADKMETLKGGPSFQDIPNDIRPCPKYSYGETWLSDEFMKEYRELERIEKWRYEHCVLGNWKGVNMEEEKITFGWYAGFGLLVVVVAGINFVIWYPLMKYVWDYYDK